MSDHAGVQAKAEFVSSYQPHALEPRAWEVIAADVRSAILLAAPTTTAAKKLLPHATAFASWAYSEGAASISEALGDPDWTERYVAVGMPNSAESTRATRRAALRRISRRIGVETGPAPEPMRYRTLKPPYVAWEAARFVELSVLQPTFARRRALGAVLALGLGAGLDGRDMGWVRGDDVRRESDHLVVGVSGGYRPREVVVLDRYAESIERLAGCGEGLVIGGAMLGRHNVTSVALTRMIGDRSLPPLLASRLRSTWLTAHLNLHTPLSLLLPAAGLASARSLGDLLPYVDPIPAEAAAALLAGMPA